MVNRSRSRSSLGRPDYRYEKEAMAHGFKTVAGIDEVGRGALAGPVVAACVILNSEELIEGLKDSKKLSPKRREELFSLIIEKCEGCSVGIIESETIDRINILNATKRAMTFSALNIRPVPDMLLIDAVSLEEVKISQNPIIKGDENCQSIAAASVIAKVTRDKIMEFYGELYPRYRFDKHKGYGTREHLDLLDLLGPTPIHRNSFKGVREHFENQPRLWNSERGLDH